MDEYIGTIKAFGFNFAPQGWAMCQGQLLPINQNPALFALLGTTYGGDGQSTFALPDLRGRTLIGIGQGPGLQNNYAQGQKGGAENITLTAGNLPPHTHPFALNASTQPGTLSNPTGAILANTGGLDPEYTQGTADTTMASQNTSAAGSGQSYSNLVPYLAINYCISLQGIFPPRP